MKKSRHYYEVVGYGLAYVVSIVLLIAVSILKIDQENKLAQENTTNVSAVSAVKEKFLQPETAVMEAIENQKLFNWPNDVKKVEKENSTKVIQETTEETTTEETTTEETTTEETTIEETTTEETTTEETTTESVVEEPTTEEQEPIQQISSVSSSEEYLLAQILFCEAGGVGYQEMMYVGSVILNRINTTYKDFSDIHTINQALYQNFGKTTQQYASETIEKIEDGIEPSEDAIIAARELLSSGSILPEKVLFQTGFVPEWDVKIYELPGAHEVYSYPNDYE